MKKISIILLLLFLSYPLLHAVDIKSVAAYPVPFDPRKGFMTIADPADLVGAEIFKVSVFDINGDLVASTSGTGSCIWNGRRSNGEYVKPGLYILKVEISDTSGGYWKKLIRVLVKY